MVYMGFCKSTYLEEKRCTSYRYEEEESSNQVGQSIGELFKEPYAAEYRGILRGRIGKEASECWADN